jgi:putative sterol carrier protein
VVSLDNNCAGFVRAARAKWRRHWTDIFSHHAVTLNLTDATFADLVAGKANAQKLFMSGKLKVKGDVMKATKLDPILKKAQSKAKL